MTDEDIRARFKAWCTAGNGRHWDVYKGFLETARENNYGVLFSPTPPNFQFATPDCPERDGYAQVDDLLEDWVTRVEREEEVRPLCDAWEALRP